MNEKEIREYLKKQTEHIMVPDSLAPDKIEEKLAQTTPQKRSPFFRRRNMAAAAVLFLFLTGTALAGSHFLWGSGTSNDPATAADNKKTASADQISYQDAYESIHAYQEKQKLAELNSSDTDRSSSMSGSDAVMEENVATEDSSSSSNTEKSTGYTDTDVQVDGIMEGDIVKTDGSYIYSLHDTATGYGITVYSVNGEKVKKVSDIPIDSSQIHDMYLEGKRLILVSSPWQTEYEASEWIAGSSSQETKIYIYDVSDPSAPKKLRTQTQSGNYRTSRIAGKYLYTFSTYAVYFEIDKDKPETYIPKVNGTILPEDSVRCIDQAPHKSYMVMTSLAIDGSQDFTDSITTLGSADVYYVSNNSIYGTGSGSNLMGNSTKIIKYQYQNGKFTYQANCQVRGRIRDSYYMHEQKGNLCFVYNKTTLTGGKTNGLCILDKNLKHLGEISNLGNDEDIYASYFIGDTAYFVTYRNTDPVFAVDISDPAAPELKSELKLPGFSNYLHSFGDNQLIGIGIGEDWENGECAKLSIFSIGKDKTITETARKKLSNYNKTLADYDRHYVMIDEERLLVGFAAESYADDTNRCDYVLFSYNQETGKFKQMLIQKNISANTRGIRIDDYFYVVDGENGVTCYGFPTCGTLGTLEEPLSFTAS